MTHTNDNIDITAAVRALVTGSNLWRSLAAGTSIETLLGYLVHLAVLTITWTDSFLLLTCTFQGFQLLKKIRAEEGMANS
jgi:hypothetical protein